MRSSGVFLLALVVFAGGTVAGGLSALTCADYDRTSDSLRGSICPTVANTASWPTLALVPQLLLLSVGAITRNSRIILPRTLTLVCVELTVVVLAIIAGS
jgi:hypothetical protein